MKYLYVIVFLFITTLSYSQVRDTIIIQGIKYEVRIDSTTHKIYEVDVIKEVTFIEKLYIGTDIMFDGNIEAKLLWDCSEYGKIGLGYDIKSQSFGITSYISLGRLHRRRDKISVIYF